MRFILVSALALSLLAAAGLATPGYTYPEFALGEHADRTGNGKFAVDRYFYTGLYARSEPEPWALGRYSMATIEQTLDLDYDAGPEDLGQPTRGIDFHCQPIAMGNEGSSYYDPSEYVYLIVSVAGQVVISPAASTESVDAHDVPPIVFSLVHDHARVALADESFHFFTSLPTSLTLDFTAAAEDAGGEGAVSLKGIVASRQELEAIWVHDLETYDYDVEMGVTLHQGRLVFDLATKYEGEFHNSYAKLVLAPSDVRIGFTVRDEWGIAHTTKIVDEQAPALRKFLINEGHFEMREPVPAPAEPPAPRLPILFRGPALSR